MSLSIGLAAVVGCLLAQSFFSGAEMALVTADREALEERAGRGGRGAALALAMRAREERLLGTCSIGANLALVAGATIVTHLLLTHAVGGVWICALAFVPFALTFGEALPRTLYAHHATALAPTIAPLLRVATWAFTPLLVVAEAWARVLRRGTPQRAIRREDIVDLLEEQSGSMDPEERELIQRMMLMNELSVEDCMTPLVDVLAIPDTATIGEAIDAVLQRGYSRVPVFRDRVDNIVGVVHHGDLLYGPEEHEPITSVVQPVRFVPDSKRADELLRDFMAARTSSRDGRRDHDHFAIVVDEYGGSVGLVTIEDMLEQIIGEIADERDKAVPGIRRLGEREWRVPARTEIEALEEATGRPLPEGDYETVAGLVLAVTGRIPEAGEVVRVGRYAFHIEVASERAIRTIRVTLQP